MSHGREKWKSGGPSAQTSDDDPPWMYHQPAPDPWEQTLNKWEKKSMEGKYTVEDRAGLFPNDRKSADWMDDWNGKVYITKPGWFWIGGKHNTKENPVAIDVELRPMNSEEENKYTKDIEIYSKEEFKAKMAEKYNGGGGGDSGYGSKWMKPAPPKDEDSIPF